MIIRETRQEEFKSLDKETFEWVYKTYFHPLCLFAQKIVGCEATAEDMVQDFFSNLWEKRESKDIASLKSYLFQGVHNECLKHLEHIKVTRQYNELTPDMNDDSDWLLPHDNNDPLSKLISKETLSKIEREIAALPEQCRKVFTLVKFEGLSYQEVADKLRITTNTVDTQVRRARKKLQETVGNLRE